MANMPFAPALWFLPCYFWSGILFALFEKMGRKQKRAWVAVITAAGMCYSSLSSFMLPLALETIPVALFFTLLGEEIRNHKDFVFQRLDNAWIVVALLTVEIGLAFLNKSVDMRSARYHNCLLYIINSLLGTMAWWGVVRHQVHRLPQKLLGWLTYLSINSMAFLCLNQFFISIGKRVMDYLLGDVSILVKICSRGFVFFVTLVCIVALNELLSKTKLTAIFGRSR